MAWADWKVKQVSVYVDGQQTKEGTELKDLLRKDGRGTSAEYSSSFETFMAGVLKSIGVPFIYEKVSFTLHDGKTGAQYRYTPDFITDLSVGGKPVVIETHGKQYFSEKDMQKFSDFVRQYGSRYYLVIVTDIKPGQLNDRAQAYGIGKMADEIWFSGDYYGRKTRVHGMLVDAERLFIGKKIDELRLKGSSLLRGASDVQGAATRWAREVAAA